MQDCFRKYPEVYSAELDDDDESSTAPEPPAEQPLATEMDASSTPDEKHVRAKAAHDEVKSTNAEVAESDQVVPKAWHESPTEEGAGKQTEK